jgi:hypothetical protein
MAHAEECRFTLSSPTSLAYENVTGVEQDTEDECDEHFDDWVDADLDFDDTPPPPRGASPSAEASAQLDAPSKKRSLPTMWVEVPKLDIGKRRERTSPDSAQGKPRTRTRPSRAAKGLRQSSGITSGNSHQKLRGDDLDCGSSGGSETGSDSDDSYHPGGSENEYEDLFDDCLDAEYGFDDAPPPRPSLGPSMERGNNTVTVAATADPPQIIVPPQTFGCTYRGVACTCTVEDHETDPSLPASSSQHIDVRCRILAILGLSFHKYHRYIICSCNDGSFLPLNRFKKHMKQKHKSSLREGTRGRDFPTIINHISTSFNISPTQLAITFDESSFNGPIDGIARPVMSPTCPVCNGHFRSQDVVRHHYSLRCQSLCGGPPLNSRSIQTRWTQYPFSISGSHSKRIQVSGPLELEEARGSATMSGFKPSSLQIEPYVVPHGLEANVPLWQKKIGWVAWRDELIGNGFSIPELRRIVTLPSRRPTTSNPLSRMHMLFLLKRRIHSRLTTMLEDANEWIDKSNSELRSILSQGYVHLLILSLSDITNTI